MPIEQPSYSFTTLTLPGIDAVPRLGDINNRGDIVGFYDDSSGEHGFLLQAGQVTTLDVPGAIGTAAAALNDAGDVVGSYLVQTGSDLAFHGFLFRDGTFTTLDIPDAQSTRANGINNNGQIVAFASASDPSTPSGGFLYQDGGFTKIAVPDAPSAFLVPEAINDHGAIVGASGNQGFVLESGRLTLLDNPFSDFSIRPEDINNEGQVVGSLAPAQRVGQGFLYQDGEIVLVGPSPAANQSPSVGLGGINDAGEIVGNSFSGGPEHAYAFIGTPETPASPPATVDWDALAARVLAFHEATGSWGLLSDWQSGAQASGTQTSTGQQATTSRQGTADGTGATGTQTSTSQQGEGQQTSDGEPTTQRGTEQRAAADGSGASLADSSGGIFTFDRSSGNDQLYGYQPELDRILLDGFSPREVVMNEGEADGREYIDIVAGGLAGTASDAIHVRVWDVANHSDIHLVLG